MSRVPPHLRPIRRHAPARWAPALATAAPVLAAVVLIAAGGCGAPPGLAEAETAAPGVTASTPAASPGPSRTPTAPPSRLPTLPAASPTGFPESYAVACGGRPTGGQVVRVLRRDADLLPAGARVTVEQGPLCAGSWQYTVVTVPGREPLAVVTRGAPGDLELVTAGTNVCSVPVRAQAPAGIRTAAGC